MINILYNLFVMPIQIIVEMTYSVMSSVLLNKGFAIIAVSLVIQTLVLPLYKRADAIQAEEEEKQKKMSHWVNHIKKTFKGDERFMILQTYYRQMDYKAWYPLKSSVSVLLQIPFFIAAYSYLSHLNELKGVPFWFIKDLSLPDGLLVIGGGHCVKCTAGSNDCCKPHIRGSLFKGPAAKIKDTGLAPRTCIPAAFV